MIVDTEKLRGDVERVVEQQGCLVFDWRDLILDALSFIEVIAAEFEED